MSSRKVILLNASNMKSFPVFPYAFIQVPAVARQVGIEVICQDLLGEPEKEWEQIIQDLIEQHNPAMVLVTLRNTDSLVAEDYQPKKANKEGKNAYFPIERTRELINTIRTVSDIPIILGGFGFSLLAEEIMHYLKPDFGVFGAADGVFTHFEEIMGGNFKNVPNLLYFQDGELISNPRKFYPPLAEPEYTSQAIAEMQKFYNIFPEPGFQGAPVEIMRGCSHACVFCAEPHVAGKQVRYRELSAVMEDIKFLADNGITQIYLISSELNPNGNEFILELAEKILAFNQQRARDQKVSWFGANYLLKFSLEEYQLLDRSGFTGGWFDITALDDHNARSMRTPYRNASVIPHLKTYARFERSRQDKTIRETSNPEGEENPDPAVSWTLFLGNPATTTETIRSTLKTANQAGLAQLFTKCNLSPITRVFDYEKPDNATLDVTYSVTPNLDRTEYRQLFPSFASPPALLQDFSSAEDIKNLFDHLAETYLSTKYKTTREWHNFVRKHATAASIESWTEEFSTIKEIHWTAEIRSTIAGKAPPTLQRLFMKQLQDDEKKHALEHLAEEIVDSLLFASFGAFPVVFKTLGLPASMSELIQTTPYELAVRIFNRWNSEAEFFDRLNEKTRTLLSEPMQAYLRFCTQAVLYRNNVRIEQNLRNLFISDNARR